MNSDSPSPEKPPRKRRAVSAARREYQRRYAREYYAKNREQCLATVAAWRAANPEKNRKCCRKSRRKAEGMLEPTDERRTGECPICLKPDRKLRCDHNHETGKIRGWICITCNAFLGPTGQDRVRRAAEYLEKSDGQNLV